GHGTGSSTDARSRPEPRLDYGGNVDCGTASKWPYRLYVPLLLLLSGGLEEMGDLPSGTGGVVGAKRHTMDRRLQSCERAELVRGLCEPTFWIAIFQWGRGIQWLEQ